MVIYILIPFLNLGSQVILEVVQPSFLFLPPAPLAGGGEVDNQVFYKVKCIMNRI